MEVVLANSVDHVLVGGNAGSFKRLRGDLLLLKREQMNASREDVAANLLLANIIDLDLRVYMKEYLQQT